MASSVFQSRVRPASVFFDTRRMIKVPNSPAQQEPRSDDSPALRPPSGEKAAEARSVSRYWVVCRDSQESWFFPRVFDDEDGIGLLHNQFNITQLLGASVNGATGIGAETLESGCILALVLLI